MDICKHKKTGKYFIYIHDSGNDEALLVTPLSEIKSLSVDQFDEIEDKDECYLISNDLINSEQAKRFREYNKNRSGVNGTSVLFIYLSAFFQ